jgi:RNA polymerase sigma-70 factor (ECF subfamily)
MRATSIEERPVTMESWSLPDDEQQRIGAIYHAHGGSLRKLARVLCRSSCDSDDLLQDTLERSMRHVGRLGAATNPRAWLACVMRNLFIDQQRRCKASPAPAALDDEVPAPAAESRAWWEQLDLRDVRAALDALPAEQRQAFELLAFEGCSYEGVARRAGISRVTAGTRILRARRRLMQVLTDCHGPDAPG